MAITIEKLHPLFAAELGGVDLRTLDDDTFAEIRAAFEEYSVIVLRDQDVDDPLQVAFSERFGPLETTIKANPSGGTPFARQSNLDMATGAVIPPDDRRMLYQKGNYFFHSDSSYKPTPSLCSLLSARIVPPVGADTEFATMRGAWDALPPAKKIQLESLVAEHSLVYSRSLIGDVLTQEAKDELIWVRQAMVRTNPVNGRKAVYAGFHASHVLGWPIEEGRAFIRELNELATQSRFIYAHKWLEGDIVIWDNRAVLHRATPYDTVKYKRLMQRTTVAGDVQTAAQI